MPPAPTPPAPTPDGALTCFGVGGTATRLYYLDGTNHPNEVAWLNNHWKVTQLARHGAPPTAPGSAMTCFGVGGTATRLY